MLSAYSKVTAPRNHWQPGLPEIPAPTGKRQRHALPRWVRRIGLALFTVQAALWGQATTSLRGTVTDSSGAAIPNAAVVLTNEESKAERTASTGANGEYEFLFLAPGDYSLAVSSPSFQRYVQTGLHLLVDTPATINVKLSVGEVTQSVTVEGQAVVLNTVDSSIGNSFNETQVVGLPLEGRNVPDLLSLQAGVAYTGDRPDINKDTDTRSGSVNGARSDQSNITLDGVDVNDLANGYAFTSVLPVTLDSVKEFRVTTTNYQAEGGRGSGAEVTLVTKSGTNQFHGSLYEYLRNTDTSANDYFVKLSEAKSGQPNVPNKLNRNIPGGSIGGPIKKNRLFFFGNFEATRQVQEQSAVVTVPTAAMRQGILQYPNVNGGVTALSPTQIMGLDPQHLGVNPVVLQYLNTFPLPNDNSVGDGLNTAGYRWRAPTRLDNNAVISRFDYYLTQNANQVLFWRGALQDLKNPGIPFLPGATPETTLVDHSKGMAVGYTAVLSPTLVNNFRYGFTRQSSGNIGDTSQSWITLSAISSAYTYSSTFQMPVHNFTDDLSWTKGKHTFQFGANVGFARDPRESTLHSYFSASQSLGNATPSGIANTSSPMNPVNGGYPAVNARFDTTYDLPLMTLLGAVVTDTVNYNYDKNGNLLPTGTPVTRDFGLNWYEFYAQDSWRIKPNFTVNYGLRWSLFPPPWEINGLQVSPSVNLGNFLKQNIQNMQQGIGYNADPLITFNLAGPANNGPGLYNFEKTDFAPRLSFAYTPRPKDGLLKKLVGDDDQTVIRGGFSKVYDRFGMQLISAFDANGAFGLSTKLTNPCCIDGVATLPRLTSLNALPTADLSGNTFLELAPPGKFPQTPPSGVAAGGTAQGYGIDQGLKTPYAYTFDLSIGRQLPKGASFEVAYVGRYAENQLAREDMSPLLDITDPKSGIDYYTAATRLTQLYDAKTPTGQITDALVGPTAAYWGNTFQPLKPGGAYQLYCSKGSTKSVVQAIYDEFTCFPQVAVLALGTLDALSGLQDVNLPNTTYFFNSGQYSYMNSQYASLFAFNSLGSASYNALQATLRKRLSRGITFDLNYTFSKALDIYSSALRSTGGSATSTSVVNSFSPNQLKGVSDFDTTHQVNANWVWVLPFGKNMAVARNANAFIDALIGGWQLSGLARWTSGFPISVTPGSSWPTNWSNAGLAEAVAIPRMQTIKNPNGTVNMFANASTALSDFTYALPGQSGSRNVIRGDGYAGLDMGLSKRWRLPKEGHSVQFRWEVFNAPNLVRFNVQSSTRNIQSAASFGNYSGLLTNPRIMQFALRYEF